MPRVVSSSRTAFWAALPLVLGLLPAVAVAEKPGPGLLASRFREPVALGFSGDGARLFVANRRSGSLSVVDPAAARVVAEVDLGRGLADLAVLPGGDGLVVVDQPAGELLWLDAAGEVRVRARRALSPDPVAVRAAPDGSWCVVASLRSRTLSFVELAGGIERAFGAVRTVELPFSPRNLVLARGGKSLIAADAFGGGLAVLDTQPPALAAVHWLPAHNIRGMAVDPDGKSLVIAHQVLLPGAQTSYEDIHWGLCINNDLRVIPLERLLAPGSTAEVLRDSRQLHLGDPGNGSGDPSAVAFDAKGHVIVALAGIDEVLVGTDPGVLSYRPAVGRRPVAVAVDRAGQTAFVANSLDDTLSIVDLATGRRRGMVGLGPSPEPTAAERGERLFSYAGLGHGGWMSCQSCHTDGQSNGLNVDTLGDGDFGAPKRVPSLLGVGGTGPWAWNGGFSRLDEQVRQSIESTMQGLEPPADQVADLVAYLRTLEPPVPATGPSAGHARGRELFARDCARCHAPPHYTTPRSYDVGLADEAGNRRFNPPSLRGVSQRGRLLHDGRARSVEEVLVKHGHPPGGELDPDEVADLVGFLKSL